MRTFSKNILSVAVVGIMAITFGACGGGGGGAAATPVAANGTITALGSITVNGIKFDDALAHITADNATKTPAFLQPGMTVKVDGTRGDDVTGNATEIEVENEVRGAVAAAPGAESFTVLGQTVFVNGGTVFANAAGIGGIAAGDNVEVHGARDVAGDILATRVEKLDANPLGDELRGVVATKVGTTFTITGSGQTFTFDNATTALPHGAFEIGETVEVHLTGGAATRVERENIEDAEFEPAEGQEMRVEGTVSNPPVPAGTPGTFQVGGRRVETTQATQYLGGLPIELINDIEVEAEGHMRIADNTLVATKIKFDDTVRFEADVQAVSATGLTVLGKTVHVTSKTKNAAQLGTLIVVGRGVKVRAFLNQDNTSFTATEISDSNAVNPNQIIFQGRVISFSGSSIVLAKEAPAGITADISTAVEIQNDNDVPISSAAFMASLRPGQTVVKVRGSFAGNALTANKAEIE